MDNPHPFGSKDNPFGSKEALLHDALTVETTLKNRIAELVDDVDLLTHYVVILSINMRDDPDCTDMSTDHFRTLPQHLKDHINEFSKVLDPEFE